MSEKKPWGSNVYLLELIQQLQEDVSNNVSGVSASDVYNAINSKLNKSGGVMTGDLKTKNITIENGIYDTSGNLILGYGSPIQIGDPNNPIGINIYGSGSEPLMSVNPSTGSVEMASLEVGGTAIDSSSLIIAFGELRTNYDSSLSYDAFPTDAPVDPSVYTAKTWTTNGLAQGCIVNKDTGKITIQYPGIYKVDFNMNGFDLSYFSDGSLNYSGPVVYDAFSQSIIDPSLYLGPGSVPSQDVSSFTNYPMAMYKEEEYAYSRNFYYNYGVYLNDVKIDNLILPGAQIGQLEDNISTLIEVTDPNSKIEFKFEISEPSGPTETETITNWTFSPQNLDGYVNDFQDFVDGSFPDTSIHNFDDIPTNGLLKYHSFDNSIGDGTLNGDPSLNYISGIYNEAAAFRNNSLTVNLTLPSDWTAGAWFNVVQVEGEGAANLMKSTYVNVDVGNYPGNSNSIVMYNDEPGNRYLIAEIDITTGWHYFMISYISGQLNIYVDNIYDPVVSGGLPLSWGGILLAGGAKDIPNTYHGIDIDEFRVYNRELSAEERGLTKMVFTPDASIEVDYYLQKAEDYWRSNPGGTGYQITFDASGNYVSGIDEKLVSPVDMVWTASGFTLMNYWLNLGYSDTSILYWNGFTQNVSTNHWTFCGLEESDKSQLTYTPYSFQEFLNDIHYSSLYLKETMLKSSNLIITKIG